MTIDWLRLLLALGLLLTPIGLFHSDRIRYRGLQEDWDGYWRRTLTLGLHSVDLARAILGGWLLAEAFELNPEASGVTRLMPIGIQAAVLTVAIILQATFFRQHQIIHAPFAFVTGVVLGFVPLGVAAFSLPLAAAFAFGGRIPSWFFPILAASLGSAAFLFPAAAPLTMVGAVGCVVALPWVISFLFHRQMVCSYRARPRATAPAPLR